MKEKIEPEKIWEVKPGTSVVTIPKFIRDKFTITHINVYYKTQNNDDHNEENHK